jgi:hypothetical protein
MNMVSSLLIPKSTKKRKKKTTFIAFFFFLSSGEKKKKEKESNDCMKMNYEIRKCTRTSSATIACNFNLARHAPLSKIKT